MNSIVNLADYPIHDLDSQVVLDLVASARSKLTTFGACHFSQFLSTAGLADCLKEAMSLESQAHPSNNEYTPYYQEPDDGYPAGHPRNSTVQFAVRYVSRKLIPQDSPLRILFEGDELLGFLRSLLPNEPLYRYSDDRGSLNYTVMGTNDQLGWHFDACELVASVLLRPADFGGDFEYIPAVRSADNENFGAVQSILSGNDGQRVLVDFQPGDMVLFRGRHSLHRVTPIRGERTRLMALMSFDNAEQAPERDVPDDLLPA
ncbi:MAG TPA: hypothetical protein EYQ05_13610 [Gammaproteobacteria bacterium]|nr:hypothetical protein [Gammaproteobacteria bacterium]